MTIAISVLMGTGSSFALLVLRLGDDGLGGDPIGAVGPSRQILQLAALAAERSPVWIDWMLAAEHAQ